MEVCSLYCTVPIQKFMLTKNQLPNWNRQPRIRLARTNANSLRIELPRLEVHWIPLLGIFTIPVADTHFCFFLNFSLQNAIEIQTREIYLFPNSHKPEKSPPMCLRDFSAFDPVFGFSSCSLKMHLFGKPRIPSKSASCVLSYKCDLRRRLCAVFAGCAFASKKIEISYFSLLWQIFGDCGID